MNVYSIKEMSYGKQRREEVIKYLERIKDSDYPYIYANKEGMWKTNDPDIKYLINKGVLVTFRIKYNTLMSKSYTQIQVIQLSKYYSKTGVRIGNTSY